MKIIILGMFFLIFLICVVPASGATHVAGHSHAECCDYVHGSGYVGDIHVKSEVGNLVCSPAIFVSNTSFELDITGSEMSILKIYTMYQSSSLYADTTYWDVGLGTDIFYTVSGYVVCSEYGWYDSESDPRYQINFKYYITSYTSGPPPLPETYISWTTYPTDSWKVGNYSTLIISVPKGYEFDFYYKQPNCEYALTPIQKSWSGPYWNNEEGELYEDYLKTCYHSRYGTYGCKMMYGTTGISEKTIYVPYLDSNVEVPDVIIIPIPDVYVDPPQWNVTLPPKYDNVSWLVDYTTFWDGVGNSINHTQYATVGLLLIPFEALNNSMSVIYAHANDASTMLQGFEHCSIIVMSGWNLIPVEIQTLFIGAAALGVVIFILHRRA